MKVDLEDVSYWMDAIRNSEDRYRTLESFWKGQLQSKVWLVQNLERYYANTSPCIAIHGGWNGVLASLLFNSSIHPRYITSIDLDPKCENISNTVNRKYKTVGKFNSVTADMTIYEYSCEEKWPPTVDIVINTSCEHITQKQYNKWLGLQPDNVFLVLQSNNFFGLNEHIRCAKTLDHFIKQSNINTIFTGTYNTEKYDRFMIIGKKRSS